MGMLADYLARHGGFVSSLLGLLPLAAAFLPWLVAIGLRPPRRPGTPRSVLAVFFDWTPVVSLLAGAALCVWVWFVWQDVNAIAPGTIGSRNLRGIWICATGLIVMCTILIPGAITDD